MSEVKNPILGYAESYRTMIRVAIADQTPTDVSMYSVAVDIERNMAPLWDAQRLRADTAEAELKRLDSLDTMQLIAELTKRNAAAEHRIAEQALILEEMATEMTLAISDSQIRAAMTVIGRVRFLQLLQAHNARVDAALSTASPATINQQGEEA